MPEVLHTVRFKPSAGVVKHNRLAFVAGPLYGFEDVDFATYVVKMGWADAEAGTPDITIALGEIDIDPETVFADGPRKGQRVLGD